MAEDPGDEKQMKRRKIHMDCCDVENYATSRDGAQPLTDPCTVPKTSRDVNQGLYPRNRRGRGSDVSQSDLVDKHSDIDVSESNIQNQDASQGSNKSEFVSARSLWDPSNQGNWSQTEQKHDGARKGSPMKPVNKSPSKITWGSKNKKLVGFAQTNKLNSYFKPVSNSSSQPSSNILASSEEPVFVQPSTSGHSMDTSLDFHKGSFPPLNCTIDLTQEWENQLCIPSPSSHAMFGMTRKTIETKPKVKSQTSGRSKSSKSSKKSKNKPQAFNRGNSFLYSGLPSQLTKNKKTYDSPSGNSSDGNHGNNIPGDGGTTPDSYGLLGVGCHDSEDDDTGTFSWFSELPLEVIENVFCRVPLMDLCLNLTLVCKTWNNIISNLKFLPWKKRYYRVLRGDVKGRSALLKVMQEHDMDMEQKETLLPGLIRFMRNYKRVTSPNMDSCLQGHPKYSWVVELFKERLTDCLIDGVPQPWSAVTALVMLSESVRDVQGVLICLLGPQSQATASEVLECLYCVATFLQVFKSVHFRDVWTSMHYRVYYALYLFENDSSATCDQLSTAFSHSARGQQTILKYGTSDGSVQYTNEQLRICNHNVGPGEVLKIVAFAGTGKTTTLIRYTQLRPHLTFLLIVYNRSIKEQCEKRFPKNVTCKTSHGLAMTKIGRRYGHKLGNFKVNSIVDMLQARKGENLFVQAKFVIDTLTSFMSSADREILLSHVPMESTNDVGEKIFITTETRELLAEDARLVWERATNPRDVEVRIPHDGYLKVFQLSDPEIDGYDVILIDEAQDLTPAVIDVMIRQKQPKILVGDPNQQIYSFRGAVNAMDIIHATSTYFLTQSFRFGSEIAFVASCCLELLKGERKKVLVGNKNQGHIDGTQEGQLAIICRSNFTVFEQAVKKCCFSDEKIKVAFAGGTKDFGFDVIQDIYALLLSEEDRKKEKIEITHPLIKKFHTLADLEKFAKKVNDGDMLGKIRIVKTYTHQLPSLVKKILAKTIKDQGLAEVVLSTAHKAKGLEFPTVRVAEDFTENFLPAEPQEARRRTKDGQDLDEYNLLYVAVTRAKKALQLSPAVMRILDYSGEKLRYPRLTREIQEDSPELTCVLTEEKFKPCALTLTRKPIKLGGGQEVLAGYYDPQIVLEDMPSLSRLYGSREDRRESGEAITHRVNTEPAWEPTWIFAQAVFWDLGMDMDFPDDG